MDKLTARLTEAIEHGLNEAPIPGVKSRCAGHMKNSQLPSVCIPICPEDRPLYLGPLGGEDPLGPGVKLYNSAKFIDENCLPCPDALPEYNFQENKCQKCKATESSSSLGAPAAKDSCVECPYGFESTSEGKCRATAKACASCARAADVVLNWSPYSVLKYRAQYMPGCAEAELADSLESARSAAYTHYKTKTIDCTTSIVGNEYDPEGLTFELAASLCNESGGVTISTATDSVQLKCSLGQDLMRLAPGKIVSEVVNSLQTPDLSRIRGLVEAGQ